MEDFGLTYEGIKESTYEEFVSKCMMLTEADIKEMIKLLEGQGFDLWMERAFFGSYKIPDKSHKLVAINTLEKLKAFIEIQLCKESKSIVNLHPSTLRLAHKLNIDYNGLPPNEKPINYYDDSLMGATYPEL